MIMDLITALIWIILIGVIVWAAYYIADRVIAREQNFRAAALSKAKAEGSRP